MSLCTPLRTLVLTVGGSNALLINLNETCQLSGIEIPEGLPNKKMCAGHQDSTGRDITEKRKEGKRRTGGWRDGGRQKCSWQSEMFRSDLIFQKKILKLSLWG